MDSNRSKLLNVGLLMTNDQYELLNAFCDIKMRMII